MIARNNRDFIDIDLEQAVLLEELTCPEEDSLRDLMMDLKRRVGSRRWLLVEIIKGTVRAVADDQESYPRIPEALLWKAANGQDFWCPEVLEPAPQVGRTAKMLHRRSSGSTRSAGFVMGNANKGW